MKHFKLWKITLLLLLGLFVFLYLFLNTGAEFYVAFTKPVSGLHFHFNKAQGRVKIYDVEPEGQAAIAGLQKDDEILAVNNTSIASSNDFIKALWGVKIGELVEIKALRENVEVKITFISERQVNAELIFLSLLPGVLFGYALCLIGTFVLLKRIQDPEAQIFYLMLIFWALAMHNTFPSGYFLHNVLPFWFRDIIMLPSWPLAIGLFLHFLLTFPVKNKTFQKYPKPALVFIYAPLVLIVPHTYGLINELQWTQKLLQYGWGIWLATYFTIAMCILGRFVKRAPNPHIKKQSEIMLSGTFLSLGIPMLLFFLPTLLFGKSFPYAEFSGILIILWPVTLAYTIVKHRFMNIDFIIKRGVGYALISGFVISAYFLLIVGIGQLVLDLSRTRSQIVTILATLFIAALFNPVKNRIQNFVERKFYPTRFTYIESIRSFGHELVNVLDLDKVLERLTSFLAETIKISPVAIYWYHPDDGEFKARKLNMNGVTELPVFTDADKVVKKLKKEQQLVDLSPLKTEPDLLSSEETAKWKRLQGEMVLPLMSKGDVVGMLSIGPKENEEPYYKEDIELLESLNDRINISLDNALLTEELREQDRMKKELEVARRIQLSSLPQTDPKVPGLDISGISIPALEVGGDYYDYIEFTDGRFGVVVGDVSGKGTSAALYMSQLKGILNTASQYHQSLKKLMEEVNAIIFRSIEQQSFITLIFGAFDLKNRKFNLVRAGHLPVLYYNGQTHSCRQLTPGGIGVGLENGKIFKSEIKEVAVTFKSGDIFLFYTDGVIEARNARGDEFETELLDNLIRENKSESALSLREKIVDKVREFSEYTSQSDDMTLVVVKIK